MSLALPDKVFLTFFFSVKIFKFSLGSPNLPEIGCLRVYNLLKTNFLALKNTHFLDKKCQLRSFSMIFGDPLVGGKSDIFHFSFVSKVNLGSFEKIVP